MGISQSKTKRFKRVFQGEMLKSFYPSPNDHVIKTTSKRPTNSASQNVQRIELHAQLIQEKNESKVNAVDERKKVQDPTKWPSSVHGVVAFRFEKTTSWGTGILIGPNVVLTAGHNLYDYEKKIYADLKSLQFLPAMNGQTLPFGDVKVDKYFVSPNYVKYKKEDYGILLLEKPIGEVTGYFGLACLAPEEIKRKKINITGYPGDKVASKPNCFEMWGMEGEAAHIDQSKGAISYLINTEAGQSGSGVWYQEGDAYYVCGVHVSGNSFVNTATLLTRSIYQQIHAWLQQQSSFKKLLLKLGGAKELSFENQKVNSGCVLLLMKYNLRDLRVLRLSHNDLGGEGAKVLAQNTSLVNLSELDLSSNGIGPEGAKAIAQNNSWSKLLELNLNSNDITTEGAIAIAGNTAWSNLLRLNLNQNKINAEGAKALAQNTSWIFLSDLDLMKNSIGAEGARLLAQNTSWTNLSQLNLSSNGLGTEGITALAQNLSWINLSKLNLKQNSIGSGQLIPSIQNKNWKKNIKILF